MASPTMNALAEKYADKRINSVFLYTHEAHPAENYPHLTSMEQKFRHAHDLRDIYGVSRPILVDALDGACHRAYGSMPNMTWIFDKNMRILYRSSWTDAASVEKAIAELVEVNQRRHNRELLTPFEVEKLDFRIIDREGFYNGLERNGPKAVKEFDEAF
jgi:hypothetical protein